MTIDQLFDEARCENDNPFSDLARIIESLKLDFFGGQELRGPYLNQLIHLIDGIDENAPYGDDTHRRDLIRNYFQNLVEIRRARYENDNTFSDLARIIKSLKLDIFGSQELRGPYLNQLIYLKDGIDENGRYEFKLSSAYGDDSHRTDLIRNYFQNLVEIGKASVDIKTAEDSTGNLQKTMHLYSYQTKNLSLSIGIIRDETTNYTKVNLYFNSKDLLNINPRSEKHKEEVPILRDIFEIAGYNCFDKHEPGLSLSQIGGGMHNIFSSLIRPRGLTHKLPLFGINNPEYK